MTYIKENWEEKELRASEAVNHAQLCELNYAAHIQYSADNSIVYSYFETSRYRNGNMPTIDVIPEDSVSAIFNSIYEEYKMAVLNFASYKHPGGMYLKGSKAQEECLCHESILYNVLKRFPDYYDWNKSNIYDHLYTNRAIYSPAVLFMRGARTANCDVITCAAPNFSAGRSYKKVTREDNTLALKSRIKMVLDIAEDNKVDTLILGAYGCGVFGQEPKEVAEIFSQCLSSVPYGFKRVIFAIPEGNNNFSVFKRVFTG